MRGLVVDAARGRGGLGEGGVGRGVASNAVRTVIQTGFFFIVSVPGPVNVVHLKV